MPAKSVTVLYHSSNRHKSNFFIHLQRIRDLILLEGADLGILAVARTATGSSTVTNGSSKVFEHVDCGVPVDAGVGDTDTLLQAGRAIGGDLLVAFVNVGLNHDTNKGLFTLAQLVANDLGNLGLVVVVLLRVSYT